nr:kielin/chordin-like protein isoform X3 [Dermacentor andersoni]
MPSRSPMHLITILQNGTLYNKLTNECIRNTSIVCRIKPRNRRPRHAVDLPCIRCQCGERDTSCKFGPLCDCNNGLFYPKNNKENCASNLTQCGIFLDASPISKECLTCKCDQGHSFCKYQNTTCNCMRGTVYRYEKYKECALQPEECIKVLDQSIPRPQEEEHCAPCQCDDKQPVCFVVDTMCHCVNGSLRFWETGKCAMNRDDCGTLLIPPLIPRPHEKEHCAPCQCNDKQAVCPVVNTMCHCVNGSLRFWETGKCATNRDDCGTLLIPPLIPRPQEKEHCAPCQCDDKQAVCVVVDTMCNCVNGRLRLWETGKCATSKDDCGKLLIPPLIPRPQEIEHCAPCQCDDKQAVCVVVDTMCNCVNGRLRLWETGKCATSKDDCGKLLIPPLIPRPQEIEHCAPCQCDDKQAVCVVVDTMCNCVNGRLRLWETGKCATSKDDCGKLLIPPLIPRPQEKEHCAPCQCDDKQAVCVVVDTMCNCFNGRLRLWETGKCATSKDDCGKLLIPPLIPRPQEKEHCAPCQCDDKQAVCVVVDTMCNCVNGRLRLWETGKCATSKDDCGKLLIPPLIPRPQEKEHCAPCQCDDKQAVCVVVDTMCNCVNGRLRLWETGKCATSKDDCGKLLIPPLIPRPQEKEHCAPCQCDDKQAVCVVVDTMCNCVNGRLRLWETGKCATSKDDCGKLLIPPLIPRPQEKEHCAPCQCDDKQAVCVVVDTMCNCVNGRLRLWETGKCATSKDDCGKLLIPPLIPRPQEKEHCAPCQCDDKQAVCVVVDTMCNCVNGRLRLWETGKCATSKDDCGKLLIPPLIPRPQEKEHCAPCQCDDKQVVCVVVDTMCNCVNGRLRLWETGKCATSKDDCGKLLIPPLIPRPQGEHCAPCQCDDKQAECAVVDTMCHCVNGSLRFWETGKCAASKDDCGTLLIPPLIPRPEEDHCVPCQCYDNQPVCAMAGSICDCVNERLHLRHTGQCAISKDECGSLYPPRRFRNPEGMCAACKCPENLAKCPVDGGLCDCINGFFLLRNSSQCVTKKEDCSTKVLKVIEQEHGCAMCNCPEDIQTCSVEGTNCDCVNRVYRYKKTGKCVRNSAHCSPFIRSP